MTKGLLKDTTTCCVFLCLASGTFARIFFGQAIFFLVAETFPSFSTPPWAKHYTMSLMPGLAFEHLIFELQVILLS